MEENKSNPFEHIQNKIKLVQSEFVPIDSQLSKSSSNRKNSNSKEEDSQKYSKDVSPFTHMPSKTVDEHIINSIKNCVINENIQLKNEIIREIKKLINGSSSTLSSNIGSSASQLETSMMEQLESQNQDNNEFKMPYYLRNGSGSNILEKNLISNSEGIENPNTNKNENQNLDCFEAKLVSKLPGIIKVEPNQKFKMEWKLKNVGKNNWPGHLFLIEMGANKFFKSIEIKKFDKVPPGREISISSSFFAPERNGFYFPCFRLQY